MKIYLHVGLHKTATTFLQKNVFSQFDNTKILYNPEKLSQLHNRYYKLPMYRDEILKSFKKELNDLDNNGLDIFISYEIMSGDLFSAYSNYKENIKLTEELFEGYSVEVIVVLRYQVDWLISTYRESVHEHHYQSIDRFLNIDTLEFGDVDRLNPYANCNAYSLDFYSIINEYYNKFDKENTHVLFFEEFKKDKKLFVQKIVNILGYHFPNKEFKREITNRGYSSNGIRLVLKIINILRKLKLNYFIPEPIYFFGEKSVYIKDEKNKYLSTYSQFIDSNSKLELPIWVIQKIKYKYFNRGKFFRFLIKNIVDKLSYNDKLIINASAIDILNEYYKNENKKVQKLIGSTLPKNYLH